MLLSILVYGLTAAILCYLGWHVSHREQQARLIHGEEYQLPFFSWEILLSILVIAVVAGARWHTGYDHEMYLREYERLLSGEEMSRARFEWGFKLISKLFASLKAHYFFYFGFWALLQSGFLYYALRRRKHLMLWVGLNIMLGIYFLNWCNSMRQAVVVCMFTTLIPLIEKRNVKNFIIYVIIILLSIFIHRSVIILLPLYFITFVNRSFGDRSILNVLILVVCILLGLYPFWFKWFDFLPPLLKSLGYDVYNQEIYLGELFNGNYRNINFGPSRLGLLFVDFTILLLYPSVHRHFKNDKLLPFYYILAFIGMCVENLLMNTSHFILRPTEYLLVFVMILSAYTLSYLHSNRRYIIMSLLLMCICSYSIIAVYKAVYRPTKENIPFLYHVEFFKDSHFPQN